MVYVCVYLTQLKTCIGLGRSNVNHIVSEAFLPFIVVSYLYPFGAVGKTIIRAVLVYVSDTWAPWKPR